MIKNVKPYKQRGDTCSVCCMMMVMEYYKVISKANWYDEKRLYNIYHSKYLAGVPFSALAYHLSKNNIKVEIYHSHKDYFSNDNNVINEKVFYNALSEYKEYLSMANGIKIINGINIDVNLLKEKIMDDKLIILAGELAGGFHAIVINGYENDNFIVCDPLLKKQQEMSLEQIDEFMNTSIGKWFIATNY